MSLSLRQGALLPPSQSHSLPQFLPVPAQRERYLGVSNSLKEGLREKRTHVSSIQTNCVCRAKVQPVDSRLVLLGPTAGSRGL